MFYRRVRIVSLAVLVVLFSLLLFSSESGLVAIAQAQSPLTAQVDRSIISADEQLTLTVTISGEFLNVPVPDLSQLTDFSVVSKSEATQISIINGRLTTQKDFIYRLQPLKTGSLMIPAISADVDRRTYQTDPITVEVMAGNVPAAPPGLDGPSAAAPDTLQGQDFFVEAEVDNRQPYLGQQMIYTFRLYQAANFLGQPDYRPPSFTDFWSQSLASQPRHHTWAAGRDYIVTEIRTALFPGSLGPTIIAPGKLVIPGGLFEPDVILESESITVDVQSLPEGAPAGFNGTVGQFKISTALKETEAKVNEPVTFVLEITGAGNVETITEPPLPQLPNWRAFESQPSTNIEAQGDVVYGTRRFERLMVPGQPGNYTFPPINFSYYDPEVKAYRTVSSDPLKITVQPGQAEPPASVMVTRPEKQQVEIIAGDIRHIKPPPPMLHQAEEPLSQNPLYWSLWVMPVLLVGGVWLWQTRQQRLLNDIAYVRSQRARRTAEKILAEARLPGIDRYAAAQRALLGYLSDKLNRPIVGLTTANLVGLLRAAGLEDRLVGRVQSTLHEIDVRRFAPVEEGVAQSLLDETHKLIKDLEKAF